MMSLTGRIAQRSSALNNDSDDRSNIAHREQKHHRKFGSESKDKMSDPDLSNELKLYKVRLAKMERKCMNLEADLEQAKGQLARYEMIQKVVKKKS